MTPADYRDRYEAGESILDLAVDADCGVREMRELLVNAGTVIRQRGGARGFHRAFHEPTVLGAVEGGTRGRIVRPSVARRYR